MLILTATCKNGNIQLDTPLPEDLEGKQIQVILEELKHSAKKRRQSGSARGKIQISPDFDAPLTDLQDYMS
jgi:hypothetical protein